MNITLVIGSITILLSAAPVLAGGTDNTAISALFNSAGQTFVAVSVPAVSSPEPVNRVLARPAQSWTEEVKKVYRGYLESGSISTMPKAKNGELPPAARKQLQKSSQASTAYRLMVKNKPAFVIHKQAGRSVTVHIFDAPGRLIALGNAGKTTPLRWEDPDSSSSGGSGGGPDGVDDGTGHHGHGGGPDDVDDGTGHHGHSGGPDDVDDGDGCGGSGPDDTGSGDF